MADSFRLEGACDGLKRDSTCLVSENESTTATCYDSGVCAAGRVAEKKPSGSLHSQKAVRDMTTERWRQIEDLFAQALERPAAERQAFLDEVCRGDQDLRSELESLLECDAPDQLLGDMPAIRDEDLAGRAWQKPEDVVFSEKLAPGTSIRITHEAQPRP